MMRGRALICSDADCGGDPIRCVTRMGQCVHLSPCHPVLGRQQPSAQQRRYHAMGHHGTLTFLSDGFTFDTTVPLSGPGSGAATYSISSLTGATIEDLSASLINDRLTDSVTFTSPGGNLVLDSNTPSGEKLFAPVSTLSGSITVVLGPGETVEGFTIHFSQIPAPSALLLLGSGFAALACVALRRHRDE